MVRTRAKEILKVVVDQYVPTATPVASDIVLKNITPKVSSATIRNDMAHLEQEGYIVRPHVSAGGVPSNKGYRLYVDTMEEITGPSLTTRQRISRDFTHTRGSVEMWLHMASSILSHMTGNMALVTYPQSSHSKLKHMELVLLQESLALMVIIFRGTSLRQQLINLNELTTQAELSKIANKLNCMFSGLGYEEIEAKKVELSPLETQVKTEALNMLKDTDKQKRPEHQIDGLRRLLAQPEFSKSHFASEVAEVIEEQVLIRSLLSEIPQRGQVQIIIGEENRVEALKDFGVILCQYGIPGGVSGIISVVGPTRMSYRISVGGIKFIASLMSSLVKNLQGRS